MTIEAPRYSPQHLSYAKVIAKFFGFKEPTFKDCSRFLDGFYELEEGLGYLDYYVKYLDTNMLLEEDISNIAVFKIWAGVLGTKEVIKFEGEKRKEDLIPWKYYLDNK